MIESKSLDKLNKDLSRIGKELFKVATEVPDEITRRLAIGANDIRNTMVLEIMRGAKTGKIYLWEAADEKDKDIIGFMPGGGGKWSFPIRKRDKPHQASAPGEAPATDKGELVKSLTFDVRNMEIEIGSEGGAPYAEYLEEGTPYMKARPFLMPAVEKHQDEIVNDIGQNVFELIGKPFERR